MPGMRRPRLLDYDVLLVDLDGVVWLGSSVISENVEALRRAAESGVRLVFLSNNSTRTRRHYSLILRSLGLPVEESDVVTSGYAAARWVALRRPGSNVYVVGEEGLSIESYLAGLNVVDFEYASTHRIDAVIVGLDRLVTYDKLRAALRALHRGALFVAANEDHVLPREDGFDPGAGSIVSALSRAAGREPDFVAGKPSPFIAELALKDMRGAKALVVGDRLDTDIELARRAGLDGLLVLTGVTREPPERAPPNLVGVVKTLLDAI